MDKVLRSLRGKKTIIGLDANAKSPLWCSKSIDDRGEALKAVIAQHGLHVLNQRVGLYILNNARAIERRRGYGESRGNTARERMKSSRGRKLQ